MQSITKTILQLSLCLTIVPVWSAEALSVDSNGDTNVTNDLKVSGGNVALTATANTIATDSADASDNKDVRIAGGGAVDVNRGSVIILSGNETAAAGDLKYYAGNAGNGRHIFYTDAVQARMILEKNGDLTYSKSEFGVRADTADAADNKRIILAGGGAVSDSRGAYITANGNEFGYGQPGWIILHAGNASGAKVGMYAGGAERAKVTNTGLHITSGNQLTVGSNSWSDFVFEDDYVLMSLTDLENYIKKHKHLPDIPSEKEIIKGGINTGEMFKLHMQKIEELTLYAIDQQKTIKRQEKLIKTLIDRVSALEEDRISDPGNDE